MKLPTVRECMAAQVKTIKLGTSIYDAIDFLLIHRISGAPIVNDANELVGVISEKDCLKLVTKGVDHTLPTGEDRVEQFMTKDVVTIKPDVDVYYAAGLFSGKVFRRFPVVENGKLIGQISRVDVLRAVRDNIRPKE